MSAARLWTCSSAPAWRSNADAVEINSICIAWGSLMPRVRPHFKTHATITHHRKMGNVYGSNDLLALWLRLGIVAIERYAARDGDRFRVHRSELPALAGGKRRDKAEALLEQLATELGLGAKLVGSYWEIHWPKFAQKQGFTDKNGKEWSPNPELAAPDAEAISAPPQKGGSANSANIDKTAPHPPSPVASPSGHRAPSLSDVAAADWQEESAKARAACIAQGARLRNGGSH